MFFRVERLSKSYKNKNVFEDINFEVNEGELISLIGPSGVGKTTLLKIISGLEEADEGKVVFGKRIMLQNPVILVFQDYILFPNMTVFDNIAFGLRTRKTKKNIIKNKVNEILKFVQLEDKSENYPAQLSAGQKQRAAIARAMVINPSVLLLDEPFANLDKNLKAETAEFIKKTQKEFKITTICVTHDLQEAFMISDKIGVMLNGELCQFDNVHEVYHNPKSYEIAEFLGHVNIIPKEYYHKFNIDKNLFKNKEYIYARAESFEILKDKNGIGLVTDVCFAGHYIQFKVKVDDLEFNIYRIHDDLKAGDRVNLKLLKYIRSGEH